ncbi:MAG: hypothetical protein ACOX9R_02890 [Armatimonadota bacterium]|jgi:hypothetical protein
MTVPRTIVLSIVLVAILAIPAIAQTPRMDGTGYGFAATAVDETASFNNPAGLPHLETFGTTVSPWPSRASLNVLVDGPGDLDQFSGLYAARETDRASGWGVGWIHTDNGADMDSFALAYGRSFGEGLSAGLALNHMTNGSDATSFDLGALYRQQLPMHNWRFGLVVQDIADEYGGPFLNVGAAVELPAGVDVGATFFDISDEIDRIFAIGAEWNVPMTPLLVRGGAFDGDLTLGAGYRWGNFEVSVAWMDADESDMWTAGVTGSF